MRSMARSMLARRDKLVAAGAAQTVVDAIKTEVNEELADGMSTGPDHHAMLRVACAVANHLRREAEGVE
ncbi:MAG: hypothetical protein RI841_16310, partial [Halomonas sp.]|uniref:hypothetical protein n=1 Tax=Halomonas sp. TaxID=1486246 RepID=UPI0028707F1B